MRRILLLVLVSSLLFADPALADNGQQTTTLLSPSGQPVGGQWQAWMNASLMPTYHGSMVLDLGFNGNCAGITDASGCTSAQAFTSSLQLPETAIDRRLAAGWERYVLLYEQAHVVDALEMTDAERAQWLALWQRPQPPAGTSMNAYWWQGENPNYAALDGPQVFGEWFAADYAVCAMYRRWNWHVAYDELPYEAQDGNADYPGFGPVLAYSARQVATSKRLRWEISTQIRSCALIRSWL